MTFRHKKKLLITGLSGKIGAVLGPLLKSRYAVSGIIHHRRITDPDISTFSGSLTDEAFLERVINQVKPDFLLHLGAISLIPLCRDNSTLAYQVNVNSTATLARLCSCMGIRMLFTSTDMVFDGRRGKYSENDTPSPSSVYGQTKMEAEERVWEMGNNFLIFRLALNYGDSSIYNPSFFYQSYMKLLKGEPVRLFEDEIRNMLYTPDLAPLVVKGLESHTMGLYHVGGPEEISRFKFGRELCRQMGASEDLLIAAQIKGDDRFSDRPADLSFDIGKLRSDFPEVVLRTPANAIADFLSRQNQKSTV